MHRAQGSILSSLKQLIWPPDRNCEESSDNSSDSDGASTQGQEGSSDDELNQGISELSVDSGVGEGGVGVGVESVEVEVCVDVRTTATTATVAGTRDSITDDLSLPDQQEYTFEDHQLVDLSHASHFDSSGFFLASSHVNEPQDDDQEDDDDDDVS